MRSIYEQALGEKFKLLLKQAKAEGQPKREARP